MTKPTGGAIRKSSSAQEAMKRRCERPFAKAKPPGTPMIMASKVELPAVIKLLSKAKGKFDLNSD